MLSRATSLGSLVIGVGIKKLTPVVSIIELLQPFAAITTPAFIVAAAFLPASYFIAPLKRLDKVDEWRISSALVAAICAGYLAYQHYYPETKGDRLIFAQLEKGLSNIEAGLARVEKTGNESLTINKALQSELEIVKLGVEESRRRLEEGAPKKMPVLEDVIYRLIDTEFGGKLVADIDGVTYDVPTDNWHWYDVDHVADYNNDGYLDAGLVYFSGGTCCGDPSLEAVVLNKGGGKFIFQELEGHNTGAWSWEPYGNKYRLISSGFDEEFTYTFTDTEAVLDQSVKEGKRYQLAEIDLRDEETQRRVFDDPKNKTEYGYVAKMTHDLDGDGNAENISCGLDERGRILYGCEIYFGDRTMSFVENLIAVKVGVTDEKVNGMNVLISHDIEYVYDPAEDDYIERE